MHENSQETATTLIDTQDVSGALEAAADTTETVIAEAAPVEPAPETSSPAAPDTTLATEVESAETAAAVLVAEATEESTPVVLPETVIAEAVPVEPASETSSPAAPDTTLLTEAESTDTAAVPVAEATEDSTSETLQATVPPPTPRSSGTESKRSGHGTRRARKGGGQDNGPIRVIPPKKVVKVLSVGLEVPGVVRRVADFGAFIDIGVGTDGLVHVSEMSVSRVAKASDLVKEGDEVTVWIKELDRDRNRISLTMVSPGTKTIRDIQEGDVITGKITRVVPYAAFVDVGVGRDGMLHIREMAEGYVKRVEDVVNIGDDVEVRVIGLDRRRQRIDLSIKGLVPEPVYETAPPVVEAEEERPARERPRSRDRQDGGFVEEGADNRSRDRRDRRSKNRPRGRGNEREEWFDYKAEDEDMGPTAMALALQAALANEPTAIQFEDKRSGKRARRESQMHRDEQDDIIDRTLRQHRQPA